MNSKDSTRRKIAVVTGAGAGVGRATVDLLASSGFDVGLLSRDPGRLESAAVCARDVGARALAILTDVADAGAVRVAAEHVEAELGPIDVWVNVAMATVFAPVSKLTPAEIERATQVTYLGQVHGMLAALDLMRPRDQGTIINVGSALAYRSVPLQAAYCGAKAAVRGFTDSLRSELIHERSRIQVTTVDLPAINTPQFDWSRNKLGFRSRPVAPVYQPEVAARAIVAAARNPSRNVFVGLSTLKAIVGNALAPTVLDRYLAKQAYDGQLTREALNPNAPDNLFESVAGHFGAKGRFNGEAKARIDLTARQPDGLLDKLFPRP